MNRRTWSRHFKLQGFRERFDQDGLGELLAESETGVTDLADDIELLADDAHLLVFAEAKLAQPIADFGRGGESLDAHGSASIDAVQRAQLSLVAGFGRTQWQRIVHDSYCTKVERELQVAESALFALVCELFAVTCDNRQASSSAGAFSMRFAISAGMVVAFIVDVASSRLTHTTVSFPRATSSLESPLRLLNRN